MAKSDTLRALFAKNLWADPDSTNFGKKIAGKLPDWIGQNAGAAARQHYSDVALAYAHFYGKDVEGRGADASYVSRSGDQGSIAELRIPNAPALLVKAWNMVVGPELTWSTVATTTDFASEAESVTARNALHYYWDDQGVGPKAKDGALEALAFGEAALHIPWDPDLGPDVGIDGDTIIRAGDIDYRLVSTWDILRDPTATSWQTLNWVIVREWRNKYDIAATAPDEEKATSCISAPSATSVSTMWRPWTLQGGTQPESDLIPIYYVYHRRTAGLPAGRQTVMLESGVILEDGPLKRAHWERLPVVRMSAGEYKNSPFPYSKFFGTLGAQQASDGLYRDLLTNATATSGCLISAVYDADLPPPQLGGGPKILYKRSKEDPDPKALELQQSHTEHFNLINRLRGENQQIWGLDGLTAGTAEAMPSSGALAALMTSTSVQNNSQLQAAWAKFVTDIGSVTLDHIQHSMKQERRVALAGKSRSSLVTTVDLGPDKVRGIDRVFVTLGGAMQQTEAGKYEIATTALEKGWVKTPEQFQLVMDTGRLDELNEDLSNELLLIKAENEALARGEQVAARLADDQVLHLKRHRAVGASLAARSNPAVLQALQAHEDQHIQILKTTDPAVLSIFSQPALAPPPGAAPAGPPQGGPPPGPPALQSPEPAQAQAQQMAPRPPKNPETGQRAAPVAGTIPPALAIKKAG